jgi:hypothetical protein
LEKIDPDRHPSLTLIRERKVIEVIAPAREVGCRGNAREGTEVVYEMGLVEVTAPQGDVCPLRPPPVLDEGLITISIVPVGRQRSRACEGSRPSYCQNTSTKSESGGRGMWVRQTI